MSFMDGKPWAATAEDVKASWSGVKNGERFRCLLCIHKFEEGDIVRFQHMPNMINFMVCEKCDGPDVKERALELNVIYKKLQKVFEHDVP